jgi:recombination associated protein RdgC
MWFRNLQLYRLTENFAPDPEGLHQALLEKAFRPCGGLDTHSSGWVPPLGRHADQLVHAANGRMMICQRREDRLLPPAVVREALAEKVEQIEAREARPVGRKEKTRLKDEIIVDLLPRAFTRSNHLYAYIDPQAGWIVVDSATPTKAEEMLSLLRETLGSLKVRPVAVNDSPALMMTRWLEAAPPTSFVVGDECELKEPVDKGAVIRARKLDLSGEEVKSHLEAGMQVTRLGVEWNERISCLLCDDLSIKRLRFLDLVMEEAADVDAADAAARFDADFTLMAMELERFLPALMQAFGGSDND